ncbi:MAG: hypothetical protein HRU26_12180 [Psychroserpens sp.]|nr:hypothetical protein [Psychroserpens sp.]
MYAKKNNRTDWENKALVNYAYKLFTNRKVNCTGEEKGFDIYLEIAIKYFRDENKIHGDTRKLL